MLQPTRHAVERLRHLGPAGGVARQAAGDAAIDHAVVERRDDLGERHADGRGAETCEEVAHGVVEDADFLALEIIEAIDRLTAPEHLWRVAAEGQQFGAPIFLHLPVDDGAVGVAGGAGLVRIERQAGKIAGLEARIVAGHFGDVHAGEVHDAELEQTQHGLVVDAHLVERRDVSGDRALGCLGDGFAPEWHLIVDRDRGWAVKADDLDVGLRQILGGDRRGKGGAQAQAQDNATKHRLLRLAAAVQSHLPGGLATTFRDPSGPARFVIRLPAPLPSR